MSTGVPPPPSSAMRQAVEISIRLLVIALFVGWSIRILMPFLTPIVSGAVVAVAVYPLFVRVCGWLGGRRKLAVALLVLLALAIIIVPVAVMASSLLQSAHGLAEKVADGTLDVPPPPAKVKDWPLVGSRTYEIWQQVSDNLEGFVHKYKPQMKSLATRVLAGIAGAGISVLHVVLAVVIAGIFLLNADGCIAGMDRFASRLAGGDRGQAAVSLSAATVRSVAVGVLGVAFIQAVLATIGMFFAGVTAVGIWALLVMLLAIVQLPPLLVLLPLALWVFGSADSQVTAWVFLVYSLMVSFSDSILKPMLLGRGVDVPMIVILLGAIGGMIASGIVGLFVGAVVLALGYSQLRMWLEMETGKATAPAAPAGEA